MYNPNILPLIDGLVYKEKGWFTKRRIGLLKEELVYLKKDWFTKRRIGL